MTNLIDNTEPKPQDNQDYSNPVTYRHTDWAGMVAAVGKQAVRLPDYEFSGRTFTRVDRLLNP